MSYYEAGIAIVYMSEDFSTLALYQHCNSVYVASLTHLPCNSV